MGINKYFKYLAQGLYSIGEAFSLIEPESLKIDYDVVSREVTNKKEDKTLQKEWESICRNLGKDLENLI